MKQELLDAAGKSKEANRYIQEHLKDNPQPSYEDIIKLVDDLVEHLDKLQCFDGMALHDDRCELYGGSWGCKCSDRRSNKEIKI